MISSLAKERDLGMQLTVTPKAAEKMKEALQLEGKADYGLRLVAQQSDCGCGSGCGCGGGVAYGLYPELQAKPEDTVVKQAGFQFFIDRESLPLLEGAEIDFIAHPEQGEGFSITRLQSEAERTGPAAEGTCECGGNCSCG